MLNRLAAAIVTLLALASLTGAQPAADAGLTKGIAQVQDGHWDDAVSTLSDVVKRLSATPARKDDLAQAYLWLGVAYAQLDSEKSGRASFREALTLDPRVSLAEGWPPKVSRLFAAARGGAAPPASAQGTAPTGDALSPDEKAVYERYRGHADVYEFDEAEAVLRDWMTGARRSNRRARRVRLSRTASGTTSAARARTSRRPAMPTWASGTRTWRSRSTPTCSTRSS